MYSVQHDLIFLIRNQRITVGGFSPIDIFFLVLKIISLFFSIYGYEKKFTGVCLSKGVLPFPRMNQWSYDQEGLHPGGLSPGAVGGGSASSGRLPLGGGVFIKADPAPHPRDTVNRWAVHILECILCLKIQKGHT